MVILKAKKWVALWKVILHSKTDILEREKKCRSNMRWEVQEAIASKLLPQTDIHQGVQVFGPPITYEVQVPIKEMSNGQTFGSVSHVDFIKVGFVWVKYLIKIYRIRTQKGKIN